MNNIIKGWITSIFGVIILGLDIVHYFGLYQFPSAGLNKNSEVLIAFVGGLILLVFPVTKLENILEGIVKKKADQI